jgi:hypothetical protein
MVRLTGMDYEACMHEKNHFTDFSAEVKKGLFRKF